MRDQKNAFFRELSSARNPTDIFNAWIYYPEVSNQYSVTITLDEYKRNVYPEKLGNLLNKSDNDIIAYFKSENIYFFDDALLRDMNNNGNKDHEFPIDYSITLDSNYCTYISKLVNSVLECSAPNFNRESIYNSIHLLLKYEYHYDYTFYLIECYKNFFEDDNFNLDFEEEKVIGIFENLVNLELFKTVDNKHYLQTNSIRFMINKKQASEIAFKNMKRSFGSFEGKEFHNQFINMHKELSLLIVGILTVQHSSNKSPKNKMLELISFFENYIGTYFERELIIAYKFFEKRNNVPILNKINRGGNQKKLQIKIENIAWDFLYPRVAEFLISNSPEANYYIPFFLSHDKDFKSYMRLFDIKATIKNQGNKQITPIPYHSTDDFYENIGIDLTYLFSEDVIQKRNQLRNSNYSNNFSSLSSKIKELEIILNK